MYSSVVKWAKLGYPVQCHGKIWKLILEEMDRKLVTCSTTDHFVAQDWPENGISLNLIYLNHKITQI